MSINKMIIAVVALVMIAGIAITSVSIPERD